MTQIASKPILLTVAQAADLLNVSERSIRRWIDDEAIPYLKLPGGGYRIPQASLLASLSSTQDLAEELKAHDARSAGISEDMVRETLVDD
jgi:excisionase family DNA binding protein